MAEADAIRRATEMIRKSEGYVTHMYLDTVDKVTIGYGIMLPSAAAAAGVNLLKADGKASTPAEREAEWRRVDKLTNSAKINNTAGSYAAAATLFINQPEAERLLFAKMAGFVGMLKQHYPGWDDFPEDAQVAMLDMAYNLGNRIHTVFKTFTKTVNDPEGPDWTKAADQSNRPQLSAERNKEVKDLFLAAAKAAKDGAAAGPAAVPQPDTPVRVPLAPRLNPFAPELPGVPVLWLGGAEPVTAPWRQL